MLSHKSSAIVVFLTDKYDSFEMINGNRGLNISKINKIIKEIQAGNNMLPYYPIQVRIVGNKMQILDGQHRFYISKKLGQPVHYIIVHEEKTMADIARVNSNVEKWKPIDFVNCYINQGNTNYLQLKNYIDEYGFSVIMAAKILDTGSPGVEGPDSQLTQRFENGSFSVNYWDNAIEFANDCKRFSANPNWRDRSFMIAIYRIKQAGLVKIESIAAAVDRSPEMLTRQANQKSYVNLLEQIFNKGKQKRIIII